MALITALDAPGNDGEKKSLVRRLMPGRLSAGIVRDWYEEFRNRKTDGIITMRPESLQIIPPSQGWDVWYQFAYQNIPEANNIANTMAEHAAGFALSGDAEVVKAMNRKLNQIDFVYADITLRTMVNFYVFGRVFRDVDYSRKPADWIKLPDPSTIDIARNTTEGHRVITGAGFRIDSGGQIRNGQGKLLYTIPTDAMPDAIIGFIQTLNTTQKTYFPPGKFQVIFRLGKTAGFINGQSIYHAVYTAGFNKIIRESNNRMMSDMRLDAKQLWQIGNEDVQVPTGEAGQDLLNEIKSSVENQETGENIYVPNYVDSKPLLKGDPAYMQYSADEFHDTVQQFIGGMGGFEAMTTGESSNRSTSLTQERIFDEKVMTPRSALYPFLLFDFEQIMKVSGVVGELPDAVWRDVTIETSNANRAALSTAVMSGWMTVNQALAVEGLAPRVDDIVFFPVNTVPHKVTSEGYVPVPMTQAPQGVEQAYSSSPPQRPARAVDALEEGP